MLPDTHDQPTPRSADWLAGWDAERAQVGRLASVVTRQRSEIDTLGERAEKAEAANQALESLLTFSPHTTTLQAVAELVGQAWRENKEAREDRETMRGALQAVMAHEAVALRDAERAQMERDCAAACKYCAQGDTPQTYVGLDGFTGVHHIPGRHMTCNAYAIRAAFAALHPESTP